MWLPLQAALEDLVKAPSNKLFPFVKLLLAENSLLQSSAQAPEANGAQVQAKFRSAPSHSMYNAGTCWKPL